MKTFVSTIALICILIGGVYCLNAAEAALPGTSEIVQCTAGTVTLYETGYVSAHLNCPEVRSASQSWKEGARQLRPGMPITCTVVTKRIPLIGVNLDPTVAHGSCSPNI